jgi:Fe-S cluster assembly iron-binding protein IscA
MLQISDPALNLLREALIVERVEDGDVFRLEMQNDDFVLGIDSPQDDDILYEIDGTTVLVAPVTVASSVLSETTIDLEDTTEGPRLVLKAA